MEKMLDTPQGKIHVYKSKNRGTWINADDCSTEYDDEGNVIKTKEDAHKRRS